MVFGLYKIKCSVINKWNRKGIRFLADLINENSGNFTPKKVYRRHME